jgi:hypothetical protein
LAAMTVVEVHGQSWGEGVARRWRLPRRPNSQLRHRHCLLVPPSWGPARSMPPYLHCSRCRTTESSHHRSIAWCMPSCHHRCCAPNTSSRNPCPMPTPSLSSPSVSCWWPLYSLSRSLQSPPNSHRLQPAGNHGSSDGLCGEASGGSGDEADWWHE